MSTEVFENFSYLGYFLSFQWCSDITECVLDIIFRYFSDETIDAIYACAGFLLIIFAILNSYYIVLCIYIAYSYLYSLFRFVGVLFGESRGIRKTKVNEQAVTVHFNEL
jgi:uncharacterized membrane protein required for colicin V production